MAVYRLSQLGHQVQENLELVENLQLGFNTAQTYPVGAIVSYQGFLWRCHTSVQTAGDWTGTLNWSKVTLKELLDTKQDVVSTSTIVEGKVTEVIGFNELNDVVREQMHVPTVKDETLIF